MNPSRFGRYALCVGSAIAILAGCGGSQVGMGGAAPQVPMKSNRAHGMSGTAGDLLYVAPLGQNDVSVYTYPGYELAGHIFAFGYGLCADTSGNVYVTYRSEINEFAHGGTTSIKTLKSGLSTLEFKGGCSVDPMTGNLAAAVITGVGVFRKAKGSSKFYLNTDGVYFRYCGYDGSGNLFADGETARGKFALAELPKGGNALKFISLKTHITKPGQVQWDGTHITVVDGRSKNGHKLYQLQVSGLKATVVGTTTLDDSGTKVLQASWIYNGAIIAPFTPDSVGFWNYPAGGAPPATHQGPASAGSLAVTISTGS